jgi:hypothetical protein
MWDANDLNLLDRNATGLSPYVTSVSLPTGTATMRTRHTEPERSCSRQVVFFWPNAYHGLIWTWLVQDRIKELEAQIRVLEEKQCASPLSPATSDRSSSRPPTHSSLPELSFASIRSPSSSGGSQAPLTPPTVLFSPDLVFPGAKSSFSPTPSHFELEPELLPKWPKSVGPDPPPDVINRL